MTRTLADSRRWVQQGTTFVADVVAGLDDGAFSAPSALPGWTRKHLVAHLAANADAIGNLVHWAASGERTPMYSSPEQRDADIEAGSRRSAPELTDWFARSAAALETAMDGLTGEQWTAEVVTAQGRAVPAAETPWMRAREVMVHAVDLGGQIGFGDLPEGFLVALCDDIVAKRSTAASTPTAGPALHLEAFDTGSRWDVQGTGGRAEVTGTLAGVAAYLSGRSADAVATPTADGATAVPALPTWL